MLLHRIHLNLRCRESRRDLSDPYQMHATLCRAFSPTDQKCPEGEFLWRLEPETGPENLPRVLIQSRSPADWDRIKPHDWLATHDHAIDLNSRYHLRPVQPGQRFRFRLRANPCVTRNHKRVGLLRQEDQESWLVRKGGLHGFAIPGLENAKAPRAGVERFDVAVSQEQMLRCKQHAGNGIRVFSVLFDGLLTVTEPEKFTLALQSGIGHGKAMGLGMLSAVPVA